MSGMKIDRQEKQRKPSSVRKREIIDAAIDIIAFEGARAFTAKNISAAVGMTSGGIFRHFDSMEAIVEGGIGRVEVILAGDFPTEIDDPLERLRRFFLNRTRTILAHPGISRLLLSDHLEQTAGAGAVRCLVKAKGRSRTFVRKCIGEAEQSGSLAAGVDAEAATAIVIGAIFSLSHYPPQRDTTKIHQLAEKVWSLLERTLRASSPADAGNFADFAKRTEGA
jgi:AcrR family transcriptional regulator